MTWFKVDDKLPSHRKILSIPRGPRRLTAVGAWTMAGAWTSDNHQDGHIPPSVLEEYAITTKTVDDLLTAGLWNRDGDGYQMHDFLDYNPSAKKVQADRDAAVERQKQAREAAKKKRDSKNGEAT